MTRGNLVLTRRRGESIEIGPVTITVIAINDQAVKVSIAAPTTMKVMRSELRSREAAADTAALS